MMKAIVHTYQCRRWLKYLAAICLIFGLIYLPIKETIGIPDWFLKLGLFLMYLLWIWAILKCFRIRITTDAEGITGSLKLFGPKTSLKWAEIGKVREVMSGHLDTPVVSFVVLLPSTKGKPAITIGPWLANYRQLLREVLVRIPPDADIDPEIVQVSGFLKSPEGQQHLSTLRNQTKHK